MNWILLPLSPHPHVILHAGLAPELQNPLFQKVKDHLLTWEKVPTRADEWLWKVLFPGPHPLPATVPPLPKGEG